MFDFLTAIATMIGAMKHIPRCSTSRAYIVADITRYNGHGMVAELISERSDTSVTIRTSESEGQHASAGKLGPRRAGVICTQMDARAPLMNSAFAGENMCTY